MLNFKKAHNPVARPAIPHVFALTALLVCLLIIYWPGFRGDWYLDDFGNIHENPNVHLESLNVSEVTNSFYGMNRPHTRINRPLSYLSLAVNYYFGATDPLGYHIVNFLIHCATTVVLFFLILTMLRLPVLQGKYQKMAYPAALLATFLWATHPIQVSAVTYIVQRMAALAGLFTAFSLYCYLRARMGTDLKKRQPARLAWFAGCLGAGMCALASKQNAAMLPISLLFLEIFLLRPQKKLATSVPLVKIILPPVLIFILLSAYFGGFSSLQAGFAYRPFTMLERLLTQPRVIFFHIGQLLYPAGSEFVLLHDIQVSTSLLSPGTTLPTILLLIGCISACFFLRRRWPLFAFSHLFFFLNHAIESSIVPLELIFEHRNYLPSFFFFILPAVALLKVVAYFAFSPTVRRLSIACAALTIMAQMHTTYAQNRLYTEPVFFWTLNVKAYPDLHRPRHNLAKAMFLAGLEDEAERQMYLSLEGKSVARKSQKFATLYNLGVFYFYKMEYQRAMQLFSVFLKSSPNHVNALKILAELYMKVGETDKAQQAIERALALAPENSSLHIIKGYILLAQGDIDGAFAAADLARALNHNKIGVGYIKAEGFRLKKEYERAIKQFNNIMRLEQDHYAALLSLIELYYLTGRPTLLKQSVEKLNRIRAGQAQSQILLIYDQRWNFVGKQRMTNLSAAMQE